MLRLCCAALCTGTIHKVFEYIDRKPRYWGENPRFDIKDNCSNISNMSSDGDPPAQKTANIYDDDADADATEPRTTVPSLHPSPSAPTGSVVFKGVHFCYPSRPDIEVLRGINFTAAPGEVIALVGSSGSGKSTCFHLLEHFYEPQIGQVLLNGIPVSHIDHTVLHRQLALVGQEPVLSSGSIQDNILYGMQNIAFGGDQGAVSLELTNKMIAAAQAANAHNFITQLPHGYQTQVGERGVQLSGGQKQRIAIARCLVNDPSILLLDEATSALDAESEAAVQQALERAMANRTTLIIAHRLSTVKSADRIIVLDRGKIVESGTHAELIAKEDGDHATAGVVTYRSLVSKQLA